MRALDAVRRALELAFRGLTGIAFAVLIASVTVQVIGRLAGASPVWTEELTRVALLYLAAFGAGLGIASGDLVDVDVAELPDQRRPLDPLHERHELVGVVDDDEEAAGDAADGVPLPGRVDDRVHLGERERRVGLRRVDDLLEIHSGTARGG